MLEALCHIYDLKEKQAVEFSLRGLDYLVIKNLDDISIFINECPHAGHNLNMMTDDIVSTDGKQMMCSAHGAVFQTSDGRCTQGPCTGAYLEKVNITIKDDKIWL